MYAALVKLTIDQARAPAVAPSFTSEILPRVNSAEGFVGGYWLDPVDGAGFGFVLFTTGDQARRAAPPQSSWSVPRVTMLGSTSDVWRWRSRDGDVEDFGQSAGEPGRIEAHLR